VIAFANHRSDRRRVHTALVRVGACSRCSVILHCGAAATTKIDRQARTPLKTGEDMGRRGFPDR
jgi:hypothetical protein